MKKNICVFGNIVADFIATDIPDIPEWGELYSIVEPIRLNIGGNGAICAAALSRLGEKTILVATVGNDPLGKSLIKALKKEKVNTKFVKSNEKLPTSVTLALVRDDGERMFFHNIGSNLELGISNLEEVTLDQISGIVISSIFLLPGLDFKSCKKYLKHAKEKGIFTVLDVSWDPSGNWDLMGILEHVDFFLPNEEELLHITHQKDLAMAFKKAVELGADTILVKQGSAGCTVFYKERTYRIKAPGLKVSDSTGAGDVFNAGFIYEYNRTCDVLSSAKFAVYSASISVTGIGGTTAAPDSRKVRRLLENRS